MLLALWGIVAVGLVAGAVVLWAMWKAGAPPSPDEVKARLESSGETSAIISGWEISNYTGTPEEVLRGEVEAEQLSWVEAWVLRPVSPMAKLRHWLGFISNWLWFAPKRLIIRLFRGGRTG